MYTSSRHKYVYLSLRARLVYVSIAVLVQSWEVALEFRCNVREDTIYGVTVMIGEAVLVHIRGPVRRTRLWGRLRIRRHMQIFWESR